MRGAGPSFGITTSITVQTFSVPPSATVFSYSWDLSAEEASSTLDAYQTFSLGQVPPEFGSELVFGKGSTQGRISITLQGVWFGEEDGFDGAINPLLNAIGTQSQNQQIIPGTYIDSVAFFGDEPDERLNTTNIPDQQDNFYVKSLLTPQGQPIMNASQVAWMNYLANEGFSSQIVGSPPRVRR
jgi:hypothetical protein